MRTIKFRGKCLDNGNWAYGGIIFIDGGKPHIFCNHGAVEVDPATVGQYTGLKDKNGRKIFEGDIVKFRPTVLADYGTRFIEAEYLLTGVIDLDIFMQYVIKTESNAYHIENATLRGDVIGNVHDNPCLQKGGEE